MTPEELRERAMRWAPGTFCIVPESVRDGGVGLFTCQQYDAANASEIAAAYISQSDTIERLERENAEAERLLRAMRADAPFVMVGKAMFDTVDALHDAGPLDESTPDEKCNAYLAVYSRQKEEIRQLRADANRYRVLCELVSFDRGSHQSDDTDERRTVKSWWHLYSDAEHFVTDSDSPPESLDAAIDAYIARNK